MLEDGLFKEYLKTKETVSKDENSNISLTISHNDNSSAEDNTLFTNNCRFCGRTCAGKKSYIMCRPSSMNASIRCPVLPCTARGAYMNGYQWEAAQSIIGDAQEG